MNVLLERRKFILKNLTTLGWLTYTTKQAILSAFGGDGTAVFNATNAYLNGMTDPTKAEALARFINEDPMMVCSLGLQPQGVTMPYRKLVSDSVAYIDTNIISTTNVSFETIADMYDIDQNPDCLFGTLDNYSSGAKMYALSYHSSGGIAFRFGVYNNFVSTGLASSAKNAHIQAVVGETTFELFVNGVYKGTKTQGTPWNVSIYLYRLNCGSGNYGQTRSRINFIRFYTAERELGHFIPMKLGKAWSADKVSTGVAQAKDTLGMIDLVTGIFYPNANSSGSFTIEYTLPDGTPWTPANQTT